MVPPEPPAHPSQLPGTLQGRVLRRVVVVGGGNVLGQRVAAKLHGAGHSVVVVGRPPAGPLEAGPVAGVAVVEGPVADEEGRALVAPADVAVLIAGSDGNDVDGSGAGGVDLAPVADALAVAEGARQVVVLSSAMVYGAWPDNAVPLTEDSRLRPNPGAAYAAARAELERRAVEWAEGRPDAKVAILRPSLVCADDSVGWMQSSLWRRASLRGDLDPPAQFLHRDDLVSALAHAIEVGLDGTFNVAADGWLSAAELDDLSGPRPRVRLPGEWAARLASVRWKAGRSSTPPELVPYASHPWVVANDALRASGWSADHSNDEVFVGSHRPGRWSSLGPQRRQQVLLGGGAIGIVAVVGGVAALLRHALGRR